MSCPKDIAKVPSDRLSMAQNKTQTFSVRVTYGRSREAICLPALGWVEVHRGLHTTQTVPSSRRALRQRLAERRESIGTRTSGEHVRKLSQIPEYAIARGARNKIESLFSELRNQIRLRRFRLRDLRNAKEQFILAATAQSLKRVMRFLSQSGRIDSRNGLKRPSSERS